MTAEINRKLYSPCNVIRKLSADYEEWGQSYIIGEKGWPGASKLPIELYGYPRFETARFAGLSLTVPGLTQTNTITIGADVGGHVIKWVYSDTVGGGSVSDRSIVNLFGSQGRGISYVMTMFENVTFDIVSIVTDPDNANFTTVNLKGRHPWEPGQNILMTISGVTVGGGGWPVSMEISAGTAGTKGANYRSSVIITHDTSTGTYTGGTLAFHPVHNPTQGGGDTTVDPESNPSGAYLSGDGVFKQGSPLIRKPIMELINTNQGYIETVSLPMDFCAGGDSFGFSHNGSKERPVIWHGFIVKQCIWINYQGNEGVHKVTTEITNAKPAFLGPFNFLSSNLDPHWNNNLGLEAGVPLFTSVHFDGDGVLEVFGDDYLNNVVCPGASVEVGPSPPADSGMYVDPELDIVVDVRSTACYRIAKTPGGQGTITLTGDDNPYNNPETPGVPYGGAMLCTDSDEALTVGVWNVFGTGFNPKFFGHANNTVPGDVGFLDADYGASVTASTHHHDGDAATMLTPGTRSVTHWIVTGPTTTILSESLDFFQNMFDREYF